MEKNLSIFSSKKIPKALLFALFLIFLFEKLLFSHLWMMADWHTLNLKYKKNLLENPHGYDIVFFGDSLLWAVNAKTLQQTLPENGSSVFNYYIANLGPHFNQSMIVKQYFKHKAKPKILLFSVMPKYFYQPEEEWFRVSYQVVQFRRYIEPMIFLGNLPWVSDSLSKNLAMLDSTMGVLKEYILNAAPSMDYRVIFREWSFPIFDLSRDTLDDRKTALRSAFLSLANNLKFIDHLEESHGQLLLPDSGVVSPDLAEHELPGSIPKRVVNRDIERILELAKDESIEVVFFFMPMWDERLERLGGEAYLTPVRNYLKELEQRYPHFRFYDGVSLTYSREHFIDVAHLNRQGFQRFNEEFKEQFAGIIKEIQVAKPI